TARRSVLETSDMRALWLTLLVAACGQKQTTQPCPEPTAAPKPAPAASAEDQPVDPKAVAEAKAKLVAKHGEAHRAAIERGVDQVASLWRASDGDIVAFCLEQFVADEKARDALFARFQEVDEQMRGHFLELVR